MSERQLYRLVAGKQTGPYLPEKLRPLVVDGRISRLDRFSYDGVDWLPADQIPELMGPRPTAAATLPVVQVPPPNPGPAAPPTNIAVAITQASLRQRPPVSGAPKLIAIGVAGVVALAALAGAAMWSSHLLERPADVTDEFAMLADSLEGYEGKRVVVRGIFFPNKLTKTAQGKDSAITFRSESGCLLNGDCAYRLTLVASEAMATALAQVADRLVAEQPAAVSFVCNEVSAGGRKRSYGQVDHVTFYKEVPDVAGSKGLLHVDTNGKVREY